MGITDYCVLAGYTEFRRRQAEGRAQNLKFVFPNIEFRLTVETEKKRAINLHLLFSPDDENHETEIERVLARFEFEYRNRPYRCTLADLVLLGRAIDPQQTDERGALKKGVEQFKLSVDQLKEALRSDEWMRDNCLVGVTVNTADGTAGLGKDDAFSALREELESMAHIIFSSRPGDREYWLGEQSGVPRESIESKYGTRKPCLHGCDAHSIEDVLQPAEDRYCWIRSELSFTGLKQTIIEPASRVAIGPSPPPAGSQTETITKLNVEDASWLGTNSLAINGGLVAIIGPKGSGKTALADMMAHCAGAEIGDKSSFLLKARSLLGDASARVFWADGTEGPDLQLADAGRSVSDEPEVRYLSQGFVDRLCSADVVHDEILDEIERVVFEAIGDEDRLATTSFDDLRESRLAHVRRLRTEHLTDIDRCSRAIAQEDAKKAMLPSKRDELKGEEGKIAALEGEIGSLLPKDKREDAQRLQLVQGAIETRSKKIQEIKRKIEQVDALVEEYARFKNAVARRYEELKERYPECGLADGDWKSLKPSFPEKPESLFDEAKARHRAEVEQLKNPAEFDQKKKDPASWPLERLRELEASLSQGIGVEKHRARKYKTVSKKLDEAKRRRTVLRDLIRDLEGAADRRGKAVEERREAYAKVIDTFIREEEVLRNLYAPLKDKLSASGGAQRQLEFYVRRQINAAEWVARGERLLDLRRTGAFQGRGKLGVEVEKILVPAWESGDAKDVAKAMEAFVAERAGDLAAQKRDDVSLENLGQWLFSTDHVSLAYGIRFDGVDLARLSPGLRGIVLLTLFLAVDEWDTRPLIIDQPEENLDPQSVFEELVPYFRDAKRRRQVILITHNPNLVVNADADQVIVASASRESADELPAIRYTSGGLENQQTRSDVCRVLEGGERAFLERERRYDLHRSYRRSNS